MEEEMNAKKTATVVAGLALGALLVAPSAFAGWGWNGGCNGPGWNGGGRVAPRAQRYDGPRDGRGWGPGNCYGYDRDDRDGRGWGPGDCFQGRSRGWNCPGPEDCPAVQPPSGKDAPGSAPDAQE